jgi:hypothetical protein
METPCPRCGTTKTESVRHGFIHGTLWNWGYHLRRCSFCNRWRIFKRADRNQLHPDDMTVEDLQEQFDRKIAESLARKRAASEMAEGNMASNSPEESSKIGTQPTSSSIGVAEAPVEDGEFGFCPKCMSTLYRRTRRRWYEKWLLKRPRMARCLKCGHRFPYPQ